MRRKARLDSNHQEVVETFRKLGCSVLDLSRLGDGCPDLCVGYCGISRLCEVKDGKKPPSKRKLTEDQKTFISTDKGGVRIVTCTDDCYAVVAEMRRQANCLRVHLPSFGDA